MQRARPDETLRNQRRGQNQDDGQQTQRSGRKKKERKEENVRVCAQRPLERSSAGAGESSVGVLPAWRRTDQTGQTDRQTACLHFSLPHLLSIILYSTEYLQRTYSISTMLSHQSGANYPSHSHNASFFRGGPCLIPILILGPCPTLASGTETQWRGSIHLDVQPATQQALRSLMNTPAPRPGGPVA